MGKFRKKHLLEKIFLTILMIHLMSISDLIVFFRFLRDVCTNLSFLCILN